MGYGKKINEEALAELERRKRKAEDAAGENLDRFYARCPQAQELKRQLAANAAGIAKAVLASADPRADLERMRQVARGINEDYDRLLRENGFTRRDVEPQYSCARCRDTGFVDGRMCDCLRQLRRTLAYSRLNMKVPLDKCSFEQFSLDYYRDDPKALRQMENILRICKSYAEHFRPNSPSWLFKGGTGLGKTHLSLAIAASAIEKGYGVIYGSAQSFAVALERERFAHDEEDTQSDLLSCDLLILDDLGTEFPSAYTNAVLYDVINTRLLGEKPTIISTNLTMKELEERYSQRFASRIIGSFGTLEFLGSDVRIAAKRRRALQQL